MFCNADDGNIVRNLNPSSKDEASISMYYEKIENYSGSTFKITFELSEGMDYLYIEPLFVFNQIFFSPENNHYGDDFTIGVSVVFLQFLSPAHSPIGVTINKEVEESQHGDDGHHGDGHGGHGDGHKGDHGHGHGRSRVQTHNVYPNISLPTENYAPTSIIRSYDQVCHSSHHDHTLPPVLAVGHRGQDQLCAAGAVPGGVGGGQLPLLHRHLLQDRETGRRV